METKAYEQLFEEQGNWLNRGRRALIDGLLGRSLVGDNHNILEIGAGCGAAIPMLAKYGAVDAIEITPLAWERLHKCYGLRTLYTTPIPFNIDCAYDAIVAMDVLEHIENDGAAMRWIADHLADDGFLVLTVPAYPWLYGFHDIATRHYRRYTKSSLLRIVPSDLRVLRVGHFNVNLFPLAVCGRIASALWRFLMRTRSESKQSSRLPRLIDELFGAVLLREARQIARGREPSLGLSLFLLAQRSGG